MFLAMGVGDYSAGMAHVITHAFFKACLFLGAGSVIHALSGKQEIMAMGGLARKIPVTFVTFAIATAAIAGFPPLAGFFSKDEILWFAFASRSGGNALLFGVAAVTALLTAFYMFRLLWLTFLGTSRMDAETEHHVHESPFSMTSVLMVLAALSAVGGFVAIPHFLEPVLPEAKAVEALHHLETPLVAVSVAIALAGLALAAWFYARNGERAARLAPTFAGLRRLLFNKYYIDELYDRVLGRPLTWVSDRIFLGLSDRLLIDGTLNGLARLAQTGAGVLSRVQTGNLQLYALFVLIGSLACLVWALRHV
jgi:NADH-quinone oxidoreductase subunit L